MNGAALVDIVVPPSELNIVLVKLAPLLPSLLSRFRILPFGALILKIRSPSNVIVTLFSTTCTSDMVDPVGIPLTVMTFVTPVAVASGTVNDDVELYVVVILLGVGAVSNCEPPVQNVAEEGEMANANGDDVDTVTIAVAAVPQPLL